MVTKRITAIIDKNLGNQLETVRSASKTSFKSQSQDQQLYFQKSSLKQKFSSKLQKIFQVPKIIFEAVWLGVANNIPFEKPKIEVHIFDRATFPGFAMRDFRTK